MTQLKRESEIKDTGTVEAKASSANIENKRHMVNMIMYKKKNIYLQI